MASEADVVQELVWAGVQLGVRSLIWVGLRDGPSLA